MNKFNTALLVLLLIFLPNTLVLADNNQVQATHFIVIPLGTKGGSLEKNLSAYLLAKENSTDFVALDAGTLMSGIQNANSLSNFKKLGIKSYSNKNLAIKIIKQNIKAYLVSHAHLDHINGLVANSPIDDPKPILGLDNTINNLRDHIFNNKIWPNLANEGALPKFKKYTYLRLKEKTSTEIPNTKMHVTAYLLNHGNGYPSTAFLIEEDGKNVLYLGDTGADRVEKTNNLKDLWQSISSLIREKKLSAIFIESSYTNEQPETMLFGHLNPKLLKEELTNLAKIVNPAHPQESLKSVTIIVTHTKPENNEKEIIQELNKDNNYHFNFFIPEQGKLIKI